MYSKIKIMGHPIHPMLVAFPIAFYTATFTGYVVYQFFNHDPFWFRFSYVNNLLGVGMALLAAVPGFLDWALGIPNNTAAKRRGLTHALLNVIALIAFALCAYVVRGRFYAPPANVFTSVFLSAIGFVLTLAAGFHGWALIATHKVGVELTPEQERLEDVEERQTRHRGPLIPHPSP